MNPIVETLKERKLDFIAGKGASEESVQQAETEAGAVFAPDFRSCLLAFGIFAYDGHEFTGISSTPRLSVVEVTKKQRALNSNIPNGWYVIEEANIDGIVIWQATDGSIYATAFNAPPVKYANNMMEFLQLAAL